MATNTSTEIETGDIVCVNFNNIEYTLCSKAKVLHKPCATGDSWRFEDIENGKLHYVSEGCTITKIKNEQENKYTADHIVRAYQTGKAGIITFEEFKKQEGME